MSVEAPTGQIDRSQLGRRAVRLLGRLQTLHDGMGSARYKSGKEGRKIYEVSRNESGLVVARHKILRGYGGLDQKRRDTVVTYAPASDDSPETIGYKKVEATYNGAMVAAKQKGLGRASGLGPNPALTMVFPDYALVEDDIIVTAGGNEALSLEHPLVASGIGHLVGKAETLVQPVPSPAAA